MTVANENRIVSMDEVPQLSWEIQGHIFNTNVRVLKLANCHIILRVDWLKTLSPVTFDFNKQTLHFIHEGEAISLHRVTSNASLRVTGVELLDDFTSMEDPWMAQLNSLSRQTMEGKVPKSIRKLI